MTTIVGVPKEIKDMEGRVSVRPAVVDEFVVERGAGRAGRHAPSVPPSESIFARNPGRHVPRFGMHMVRCRRDRRPAPLPPPR